MEKHIKALGVIFLSFGALGFLGVLMSLSMLGEGGSSGSSYEFFFIIILIVFMVFVVPPVVAGYGLFKMRSWSRVFGIILSSISLLLFPIGTAIGAYGLWILTNEDSKKILGGLATDKHLYQHSVNEVASQSKEKLKKTETDLATETLQENKTYDMESFNKGEELYEHKKYEEASNYFIKVAHQGFPEAQNYIGYMFLTGLGIEQDNEKAFSWYQSAASSGHAPSQNSLGYMYHQGTGIAKDLVKAKEWYQKAAEQGNEEARQTLKEFKD